MNPRKKLYFLIPLLAWMGSGIPAVLRAQTETSSELVTHPSQKKKVFLKVPFKRQSEQNLCGIAAIQMITGYYGQELNASQYRFLEIDAEQNNGITGATMEVVLRASDYYTAIFKGTLDWKLTGLYRHLDLQRPLVVMVASEDGKTSHYGVVTGYDSIKQQIVLSDPAGDANEMFSIAQFEAGWKRASYFTLLAVPKDQEGSVPPPTKD